jgi:hypothetical protein
MKEKDKKLYRSIDEPVTGQPKTDGEVIHKYGTYEIQPTAESENEFPEIAQGLPKNKKEEK